MARVVASMFVTCIRASHPGAATTLTGITRRTPSRVAWDGLGRRCLVPNSPIPSRVMDCFTRSATLRSWVPVYSVARLTHGLIREHTRWHPDLSTYTAVFGRGPMIPSVTAALGVSVPTSWLSPQTPRCTVGKHPLVRLPSPRVRTA